jgi:N-acetylmuramoyl-L-alanine amidase
MRIAISSGHGKHIRGASGSPVPPQLDEVNEVRRVVETVAEKLRKRNVTVMTFHDDHSTTQSQNLNAIVDWHNQQKRDYDVSVHMNAFDHHAHGTEVLYVTQKTLAAEVSSAIADAGGFHNRGAKSRPELTFLNSTEMPAILLEICFCDNTSDSHKYHQHYDEICEAIAGALAPEPKRERWFPGLPIEYPSNQQNITCTVFGGDADPNYSAYDEHYITDEELGCALPDRFEGERPQVIVLNTENGKEIVVEIVDVGPWNTDDPYWETGTRPQAEGGVDEKGRTTNHAGIDLTPGAAKAIGLEGKGVVHWAFMPEHGELIV